MPRLVYKRRFEFISSGINSYKYWEVSIRTDADSNLAVVETQWGRIGTSGNAGEETCGSVATAKAVAEKKCREKMRKGYKEVTPQLTSSEAVELLQITGKQKSPPASEAIENFFSARPQRRPRAKIKKPEPVEQPQQEMPDLIAPRRQIRL